MRRIVALGMLAVIVGCSQNYSEKKPDEALAERGLKPAQPMPSPHLPAGHPPLDANQATEPSSAPAAAPTPSDLGGLAGQAPAEWRQVPPSSSMRLAEYALPGYPGGTADAVLAVFHFGQNQGGGVEANIQRWFSQFIQPDGGSTEARARRSTRTVRGMPVTLVDLEGTYNGGMGAGGQGEPQPGYRMLGAVVEAPRGTFFYKLTGPRTTVAYWAEAFSTYLESLQP
ncbi:MAG: hypothetical protein WDA75_14255 [Candidatus Latescibacterota bacterium]|jgi:hypothetical protein